MAKHLITGAAGFVGSHLARALLGNGDSVWGIDNLNCGFKDNIDDLLDNHNFKFILSSLNYNIL